MLIYHQSIINQIDNHLMPRHTENCKKISVDFTLNIAKFDKSIDDMSLFDVEEALMPLKLKNGGRWEPNINNNSYVPKVAIIVPYRSRKRNLNLFLLYMHQFLTKQNIYYGIYIIEPSMHLKFNRALLINIGFLESLKEDDYNCFIFHDVDLLPENINNIYNCDLDRPKQMAISVNINGYP